jgi:hypothetical protein
MTPHMRRARFWIVLMTGLCAASPSVAEMIRWGYGGSIHGGGTWEVRPDDTVVYAAYQAEGAVTERPEWVWDDQAARVGHITFAIPGAYGVAQGIVTARIRDAGLGPAVDYRSNCDDAGSFIFEVDIDGFAYTAVLDNCIPRSDDAPPEERAQYDALQAGAAEISAALRLDALIAP